MGKFINLTGQKFGRLLVLERVENYIQPNGTIKARWKCLCECGKRCIVCSSELRYGRTKSCGCFKLEKIKANMETHGKSDTRLYIVWKSLKKRCNNPKDKYYHIYGGRGITVCDEWLHNFQAFYDWSIANGYDETAPIWQCTIERTDNTKGYSPDNCKWTTNKEQANNRRNNHLIEYQGKKQNLTQWAKEYGIKAPTLRMRLKHGWSIEKSLTTPLMQNKYSFKDKAL